MIRSVLAVMAGILVGGIVVGLLETPGMFLHPPPPGLNLQDPAQIKAHFAAAPLAAQICVAIAWTFGPLVGSFVAARIARRGFLAHGIIVGLVFLAADVFNLRSFPHPAWLAFVGVVSPLAMSWLGSALAAWTATRPPTGPQSQDMRQKNMAC
jgi:hypothetical protein